MNMTIGEFLKFCEAIQDANRPSCLRRGQFAMGKLFDSHPELYRAVTGTHFDPFYVDAKLPIFLAYILMNHATVPKDWNEPQAAGVTEAKTNCEDAKGRKSTFERFWDSRTDAWKHVWT